MIDPHKKVTVYSPESGFRRPLELITNLWNDFTKSHELGWRLFIRSFKGMYRQSFLGLFWAFIPPLLTSLVWVFLSSQRIVNIDDPGIPYPVFVITSVLLWSVFAQALQAPISTMMEGKAIMVKINFPKEAFIISAFLQVFFDFLMKLALIAIVFVLFRVTPSSSVLMIFPGVLAMITLGMSLGLVLLPVGMLYTDIQRVILAIVPFWMLLTPVIYPTPRSGIALELNRFNPVTPLLTATRDWMFRGSSDFVGSFLWVTLGSVVLLFFGMILFRLALPIIIERSGS